VIWASKVGYDGNEFCVNSCDFVDPSCFSEKQDIRETTLIITEGNLFEAQVLAPIRSSSL